MRQASKDCARCGRVMTYRKKWAKNWADVKYCSAACRAKRLGPLDKQLETTLLEHLEAMPNHTTVCPSLAARALRPQDWRKHLERSRQAARRLVHAGHAELVQNGRVVDPSHFRGAVTIRLKRKKAQ